jgi:putative phage-type endonuclease
MIVEQRSPEWFDLRRGKITSSEIHKIMGDKGFSETAKTYLLEKVCEFYGGVTEPAQGAALNWGIELEPVAIKYYEELKKVKTEPATFTPVDEHYGGSPDGLLLPEGIIEVKCPYKSANHFKHGMIKDEASFKKIAPNYYYQCISNMICTNTKWCDFISYDPRVKDEYMMFIYRLELQESEVTNIKERVKLAVEYMNQLKKEIESVKLQVPNE